MNNSSTVLQVWVKRPGLITKVPEEKQTNYWHKEKMTPALPSAPPLHTAWWRLRSGNALMAEASPVSPRRWRKPLGSGSLEGVEKRPGERRRRPVESVSEGVTVGGEGGAKHSGFGAKSVTVLMRPVALNSRRHGLLLLWPSPRQPQTASLACRSSVAKLTLLIPISVFRRRRRCGGAGRLIVCGVLISEVAAAFHFDL